MSENNDISSSSKSLLSEDVIEYLNKGMNEGLIDDFLGLSNKKINDSTMPELCEWIIKLDNKVKKLDLDENQITSVSASMLFDTLNTKNSSLKEIYLHGNRKIDDKCMKSLGEYIKSNKNIESISLNKTSVSDTGIEILAPYLDENTTFKQLRLNFNGGITDKSKLLLIKMIESSCVEDVGIILTSITQKNIIYVLSACNGIKNGSKFMDWSFRQLNDNDLIKICDAMKKYGIDKLKEINLKENNITSKGTSLLFDTLKECNSIVSHLYLSHNQLDDECMKQLGEYLQDNEYINELILGNNKITDKGIEILSEYLIGNISLEELGLDGNSGITDASIANLIEMVNRSCIAILDVDYTSISQEKQQEIKEALKIPIEEREIPIKSNTKSAAKISSSTSI